MRLVIFIGTWLTWSAICFRLLCLADGFSFLLRFNSLMYFLFLFFFYNNVFLFFFFFPFIIPLLSSLTQIKFSFLLDSFFILFLSLFISIACTFNAIKEKNYIKYLFYFLTFTFFFNSFVLFSLHFSLFFLVFICFSFWIFLCNSVSSLELFNSLFVFDSLYFILLLDSAFP